MGARLTGRRLPTGGEYLDRWSLLHGGATPGGLVGWWLRLSYRLALPLARGGIGPDALTIAGVVVAAGAVVPAASGGHWPVASAALVAASGVLDSLDGAVAVLTGRTTRWGFVLDSLCDRVSDAAYAAALYAAGAPAGLALAGAAIAWLHEYLRSRAAVSGMPEVGLITVSERPTRVIVAAMFLLGAGLFASAGAGWAAAGALAMTTLGVVGFVQLLVVVRGRTREP